MGLNQSRSRRNNSTSEPTFNSIDTVQGVPITVPVVDGVIPAAPAAAAAPSASQAASQAESLKLNLSAEKGALSFDTEQKLLAMISLKAPDAPVEVERPAIDLVAVIDRSGSMQGQKMNLVKQTLELLVKRAGLKEADRISLVSFDREVKLELPLSPMDGSGRRRAEDVIKSLHPGSTTNLSGGALKAIDILDASAEDGHADTSKTSANRTRAVMLFTDGLANEGIRDPSALQAAVTNALTTASAKLGGPISFFTFGFGRDHNETCLRELAANSSAGGLYYYVKSAEDIPNAFADCLGGLTSVVAQNATLKLEPVNGVSIARVIGNTYTRDADGAISLGDLFAEDEKDVLVELNLPRLPELMADSAPVMHATLRGFNVPRRQLEVVKAELCVARPAITPSNQPLNQALDVQRNRLLVAEAMEEASRLADRGDLANGRQLLQSVRKRVADSPSCDATLSLGLVMECEQLERNYASETQYRSVGSKMSKMSVMSHSRQRANHVQGDMYVAASKRKALMKSNWASSLTSGGCDSDSD